MDDDIVAGSPVENIDSRPSQQNIISIPSQENVAARPTDEHIVADATVEGELKGISREIGGFYMDATKRRVSLPA